MFQPVAEELLALQSVHESSTQKPSHDDVLDEIRMLSNTVLAANRNGDQVTSEATKQVLSLADELAIPSTVSLATPSCTGWRTIGS